MNPYTVLADLICTAVEEAGGVAVVPQVPSTAAPLPQEAK